ncbi:hypothetical protein WOLCODRAFT_158007 [Wolfiporia cocos MD-104 SS10]|uniref:Uncharacterized protein n=1 Tax=Wolfiporia cocos (strain MD-104) TaxID=742152 RepID=A0A2H3JHT1_WOLCO|nr:hypothetical protein WOLCODRAFT_158007 [Wolfiporia cocos MD-104 SS10]
MHEEDDQPVVKRARVDSTEEDEASNQENEDQENQEDPEEREVDEDKEDKDPVLKLLGTKKEFKDLINCMQHKDVKSVIPANNWHLLKSKARNACNNDVAKLKRLALSYLPDLDRPNIPKIDHNVDKKKCGFHHPTTGRLLVPHKWRDDFDKDPAKFCQAALKGEVKITADHFLSLCYPENEFACFAYSAQEMWSEAEDNFVVQEFYENIIKLFTNKKWGEKMIAWWNKEIWGRQVKVVAPNRKRI